MENSFFILSLYILAYLSVTSSLYTVDIFSGLSSTFTCFWQQHPLPSFRETLFTQDLIVDWMKSQWSSFNHIQWIHGAQTISHLTIKQALLLTNWPTRDVQN